MTKFKAVIFDWAGTMIDFGSFAPMGVFVEVFSEFGLEVTIDEAREPMGMAKWDHIQAMLDQPRIAQLWLEAKGSPADTKDIDAIYAVFVPKNEEIVTKYAALVPGAGEMIADLRARGLKIGSTTGYTRSIMANVLPLAAEQGYTPDNLVCSDDGFEGRPSPLGMYQSFVDLGVYPPECVIKVDDTMPGIGEGKAAGCVTVGVSLSGNYVGKTPMELAEMSEAETSPLRENARKKLLAAGADHVIDTVADLPSLISQLEAAFSVR